MGSFDVYVVCVCFVFFSRRFRSFMHFVWRHSIFTVIVHTIVKTSDAKIKSQLTKEKFINRIRFPARDFQFVNKFSSPNFGKEKIICVANTKFPENIFETQFHCTTMAPRRGAKKATPTVQAEAAVADSASDAVASNGIASKAQKSAKSPKSAPAAKENPKKATASKKKGAEQTEQHEQENGGGAVEIDVVEPVSVKADPKSKKAGTSKKNAKAAEQNVDDAGEANGQTTNGDAPTDGKKRAAKGKQKKAVEEVAPVKETKAAKGKSKKGDQEAVDDSQNEPEPGPSNADKKKGKSTKKNVEPVEEVEARGRGRGAKKPVTQEKPEESVKPVKEKAKKAEKVKKTAKGAKPKQNEDEPVEENDDVEKQVAPTKSQGRKRGAPATSTPTEKSPAKKGKKDTSAAKLKANGTPNKKRKAGVQAVADSTTDELDGGLVTKRTKKGSKKDADSNAEAESKMNPTETDLSQIDFESEKEFTLKIASWNVAGLRALVNKNGMEYFEHEKPDIICLQVCQTEFFFKL